ncbi:MAG: FAD-binding oxidoreductase [Acidobacteria bacterium]|nr:FAD-binding oxidoreductase [Acidobacteriota bacterium]
MQVKTAEDGIEDYLIDASNMPGGHAERVFVPDTADEIAETLREANEKGIGVTVSGARTGTVGGAVPFGGWVISMERLNKIVEINKKDGFAIVQSAVVLSDLQRAVEAEGLFYPPDPTEWSCQIGGTIATNASGARSFKYGATRSFVRRLEIVLPDGETLTLRRGEVFSRDGFVELETNGGRAIRAKLPTYEQPDVRKNASGFVSGDKVDAIDLFIGSEGTLGVIVEAELALLPKPESFFSGIVFFESEEDLLNFVAEARESSFRNRSAPTRDGSVSASLIEYFDDRALKFISEKFPDVPESARGAIFFEQETTAGTEGESLDESNDLLAKHDADLERSWFTTTETDREKLRDFRHALPVAVNERIVRNKQKKIGTDMAVPDRNFASFLTFYKEKLEASGLEYVIFGHIADNHLHANMIPKNDEEAVRAKHLYGRFIAQSIMLGGTISAEHGIGKHKAKYLYVQYGERYLNEMAELKRAFDPKGLLGRGNMIDERFI